MESQGVSDGTKVWGVWEREGGGGGGRERETVR